MTIKIGQFRLSLIWTEAFPFLLDGVIHIAEGREFLGRSTRYVQRFDEEQERVRQVPFRRDIEPGDIHLPWSEPWGQRFWLHYLGGTPPGMVSGATAWNALVPFRTKTAPSMTAPWLAGTAYHETFLYPHGIGFILTATFRPERPVSIKRAVNTAFDVRRDRAFKISLGDRERSLVSERLANTLMDEARLSLFEEAAHTERMWEPFTVLTVISADGAKGVGPPPPELVAALEAVTSWRRGLDPSSARHLTDANKLPRGGEATRPADLLYAQDRGRAVWFPRLFGAVKERHALGCFHRNLTLLSLQVESLSALIRLAARFVKSREDIPVRMYECMANALRVLDDLSEGKRATTYRSHSPKRQLEKNDMLETIVRVREFLS